MGMRVLVVEDDDALRLSLRTGLGEHGFTVDTAADGATGLEKAELTEYDVVVLDRDLPVLHGDDVCRRLHASGRPGRVLMLTASSTLEDLLTGLDLGADDYLAKPFRFAELAARVRALSRRTGAAQPVLLRRGDIELDPGRLRVARGGREVVLTPREFAVLECLLRADGAVVSAETLIEKVWDEHADPFTASVRVIMSRLRSKLGPPAVIETVIGRGYQVLG